MRSIIEAFENGKRLADLPEVEGTNPFELLCEVLDTDGESKKAALATFMPYLEENCAYGIEYDVTLSSPECTRIGNMELHKSLPIQSRMMKAVFWRMMALLRNTSILRLERQHP